MKIKNLFGCIATGMMAVTIFGVTLYAGGGDDPALDYIDRGLISCGIVPLSNTTVFKNEDVLFEVTIVNRGTLTTSLDLWFTADLYGLESERHVIAPYIDKNGLLTGDIRGEDEVVLRLRARPLDNVPAGPYTFYSKVGTYEYDMVKSKDSFSGYIREEYSQNPVPGVQDSWAISSVWAVNEAGQRFLTRSAGALSIPKSVDMVQNYPNPFNPSTNITFKVIPAKDSASMRVSLAIYNVHGQLVRTLVDEVKSAGLYTVKWDGTDKQGKTVNTGVYIFKLQSGDDVSLRKGVLAK